MQQLYTFFIFLIAFLSATVFGQVELYNGSNTTTNLAGQTIRASLYGADYEGYIYLKNISEKTETFKLIRKQLNTVDVTFTEQLCFGSVSGENACFFVPKNTDCYDFPTGLVLNSGEKGIIRYNFSAYNLPSDIHFRYYLTNNNHVFIDSIDVKATASLSVKENIKTTANASVSSFPNPINGSLMVTVTGSNNNTVKIVDILGKVIYVEKIGNSKKIDISNLNNGVYILTITTASGTTLHNKKIIVKH